MRTTLSVLLVALLATVTFAQPCPDPNDVFWQRDTLPTNPTGLQTFSIIPGLCEGEAAAIVFELPVGMPPQQITQVVCPFGSAGGGQGALAYVNVEVYDGVSFSGAIANMGTQVFDLNTQTGNDLQVTSSAFNTFDTTQFNIVVGNDPVNRRFAIAFRMNLNPNGNCTTGYFSTFFTDNTVGGGLFCNPATTPPMTSLMDIIGQGWRDAALATVTFIPLCPLYYAGIWGIRCCSRNAAPPNPFQILPTLGVPATSPGTTVLQLMGPGLQGVPYQFALSWANTPPIQTPSGNIPLTYDALVVASLDPAFSPYFVNFTGNIGSNETATVLINVPPGLAGMGLTAYGAWIGFLPTPPGGFAISDNILLPIQ